ncbi:bombesin receptor subtype-3-like [Amphiura filiformis]|uniref:bombesin receptor subtype-3-like n=1 Tax=Amphiura filiformis TaxID=82378 RepID=UPI003B222237
MEAIYNTTFDVNFSEYSYELDKTSQLSYNDIINVLKDICAIRDDSIWRLVMFVIFIAFGFVGNVALLIIILKNKNLRNAPNILIGNLTVADLLYIVVTGPIKFEHELHPCWLSGRMPCALRNYAPVVCQCACAYSLVALSRERYSAIVHGVHSRKSRTKRDSLCFAIIAWVLGFIVASPILTTYFTTVKEIFNITISCQSVERGSRRAQIFECCKLLIVYIIPFMLVTIHYTKMAYFLISSTNTFREQNETFKKQTKARKRLAYITITITIFFCLFSLPSFIYSFMFHFKPINEFHGEPVTKFRHFYYFMSLANSSLNPWLVFVLSSAHRECLAQCFGCLKCSSNSNLGNSQRTKLLTIFNNSSGSTSIRSRPELCVSDTETVDTRSSISKSVIEYQL